MSDRLQPLDNSAVEIDDDFWNSRLRVNREVTLAHQYEQMQETGRVDNFRKAGDLIDGEFEGRRYNDSDVYKWVEAASNVLATRDDPELKADLDAVVDAIAAAQTDDGYLNSYVTLECPDDRWTNLGQFHELYCAGHLIEAAVAHHRVTGEEKLLSVATRLADHIAEVFGPDGKIGYPGHEEIELALVSLYRETGVERYLDLAKFFVDERGREDSRFAWELEHPDQIAGERTEVYERLYCENGEYDGRYAQDHAPVREQDTVEGHAVRAAYLYSGMADVAAETGDESLLDAVETLWRNATERRMYVTGGIGSSYDNEGFTTDYDLPTHDAYAETCAAVANVFWNRRMLELTSEGQFGDILERSLYNGVLSGVSLDGDEFFYVNPLASEGDHHRRGWFECACCPPNVARLLASLDQYVYLKEEDALYVALYLSNRTETEIGGTSVELEQETDYPWDGTVNVDVAVEEPVSFDLRLRLPGWCDDPSIRVNGDPVDVTANERDGFVSVSRTWRDGDAVTAEFPMPVRQVRAHPSVRPSGGRIALRRGPLIYCVEEVDNDVSPDAVRVPADASFDASFAPELLDGVVVVHGEGTAPTAEAWSGSLYRDRDAVPTEPVEFTAVPYYAWDHREPGQMRVFLQPE
jgi:DUF1680 family protein